uniref:uncharacterized protein LOC120344952 n=1 Tax=Styela clava TaxID=7725 RepID=UPI00193A7D09|nr:uncharacterized protein LOC120344952 [Styela clava]
MSLQLKVIIGFALLCGIFITGFAQDCPTGWNKRNDLCYYFSEDYEAMTFTNAESFCETNGGTLVTLLTVDERDWVTTRLAIGTRPQKYWIGLTDLKQENVYSWIDGNDLDPAVANWKLGEPNDSNKEDCVEIWIEQIPLMPYDKKWNDKSCSAQLPFVCKRTIGDVQQCPVDWTMVNGRCYQAFYSLAKQWFEADQECRNRGGDLVAIGDSTEQLAVQNFISTYNTKFWIGLSDTASPGNYAWSDRVTTFSYNNWDINQPPTSPQYYGSSCVVSDNTRGYKWVTERCVEERPFVCERGLRAQCPQNWAYTDGKCYEFVVNSARKATWTEASRNCQAVGAGLIKIESEQQQLFVATAFEQYGSSNREIWMGISDIGHDDILQWWDKQPIQTAYWDTNPPPIVAGRDDCANLYTGKGNNNWEITGCYLQLGYICEIAEGKSLASLPVVTVQGKCEDGWRHYSGKCYLFWDQELSQQAANTHCRGKTAELVSIHSQEEQSFIVGHLPSNSWIGLNKISNGVSWTDGSTVDYQNWRDGYSTDDGCVFVNMVGEWDVAQCAVAKSFICKKDDIPTEVMTLAPPTYVPDLEKCGGNGWVSDPQSPNCYKINLQRRSWNDARYQCQVDGGDLASVNTPNEQIFLQSIVKAVLSDDKLWLGGNDKHNSIVTDQGWRWSDSSPFNYIHWVSGEPNNQNDEDCMHMWLGDGKWNDADCYAYMGAICEKVGNNVVPNIADSNCRSNEACCFDHIGCEFHGGIPDSSFSASTEKDKWFAATRGRLNTPADVVILSGSNPEIYVGTGHGAWEPQDSDPDPYLQVDLPTHYEIKGIITQGRNGLLKHEEMQWTRTYKVSYSQDTSTISTWTFITDASQDVVIFDGNFDQNTMVTNFFPRPIIARHIRCHPMDYRDRRALRLEYIGCRASCLYKLGMNSGYIPDNKITASSTRAGHEAKQARAPVDNTQCLSSAGSNGKDYRGWISKTKNGKTCQPWNSQTPHPHSMVYQNYPEAGLVGDFCRNPDGRSEGPWCYTLDPDVQWEACDIPVCPNYTPTGWQPSGNSYGEWVQVQFDTHYKVSGITLYGGDTTGGYVTEYVLWFSDSGFNFRQYVDIDNTAHRFVGLDGKVSEYMDILSEPISAIYIRIEPTSFFGSPVLRFEVNGCYIDRKITCSELASNFLDETTFGVDCPAGCLEDASVDPVFGTDIYTTSSAICPAAIHAGKANDKLGGAVFVTIREGQSSYAGSYQHGITSESYGAYPSSFSFTGYTLGCDDGWYTWGDNCYWHSPKGDVRTWQAARTACLSMGADLASIGSSGENDFMESLLIKMETGNIFAGGDDAWIGMSDLDIQDYYLWSDGSPVTYTKWFYREPNGNQERCVQIYIQQGYWNDIECDVTEPYICKRVKQFKPPSTTIFPPTDAGCEPGWTAFGPSCYRVSNDEFIQAYADIQCQEMGSRLVSIHDDYEQAFVHALVTSQLPAFSGYTAWIGFTAHTDIQGGQYFTWQRSEEMVTYTHWDAGEPDAMLKCTFPFVYKGVTYYECTTVDNPVVVNGASWCSIDAQWSGRANYCGNENPQGCTYMDDRTGYWNLELCIFVRYYICEKDRAGYTQPVVTTPDPNVQCPTGWMGNENTVSCYQINEKTDRAERLTWDDALDNCRAQGADLLSLHSSIEESAVWDFVAQTALYSYTSFWMGLNNKNPDAGYVWTDETPVSYTNWAGGEPSDHNGAENCVETQLTYGSMWNDLNCDALRNWVCKIGKRDTPLPPPTLPAPQGTESTECGTDVLWIKFTASDGIDKCYHFETAEPHSWPNAEKSCAEMGGHLVSMHSIEEKSFVLSRIASSGFEQHWIGLRDVALQQWAWSDGSTLNYVNWAPGEPNNYLESEGCAEMTAHDGNWNDDNCGLRQSYICMKNMNDVGGITFPPTIPPEGNCPSGYYRFGSKCWTYGGLASGDRLNWYDARQRCENISATLAVVENEYEQAYVSSLMYYIGRNAWIGMWGSYWNPFVWIDQSSVYYTNWGSGQPDFYGTSCVKMDYASHTAGKWNDDDCYGVNAFICYQDVSEENPPQEATPRPEQCPNGYKLYGDACFKYMSTSATWDDARTMCQNEGKGIDLVSIYQGYENNMIKSMFWQSISADSMWIGMQYQTTTSTPLTPIDSLTASPILTETTFTWADGWPVEYTNWGVGEPDVETASQSSGCVYMNRDGSWSVVSETGSGMSCGATLPFMCKKSLVSIPTPPPTPVDIEGTCDPGFVGYGAYCYYIERGTSSAFTRSFWEARGECETRGATLASFHGEDECLAIVNMITGGSHNLWTGLTHDGFSGWRWVDETPVDFFNWVPGEPNGVERGEVCVEMYPWDGQWNDVDCFQDRGYICRVHKEYAYCGAVPVDFREDCGYTGIDESVCLRRGCCWDETVFNSNFSGCFYPANYEFPSQEPIPSSGLSGGAIAGIVIGILLLVVIAGVAFWFSRDGKSVPSFSMFSGNKSSQPSTVFESGTKSSGFDNPVVGLEGSTPA